MNNIQRYIAIAAGFLTLSLETVAQEAQPQQPPAQQTATPTLEESMNFIVEKVELYGGSPLIDMIEFKSQYKNTVAYKAHCLVQITNKDSFKERSGKLQTNTTTVDIPLEMVRIDHMVTEGR
mgnify:CR=1 FL=1